MPESSEYGGSDSGSESSEADLSILLSVGQLTIGRLAIEGEVSRGVLSLMRRRCGGHLRKKI